MNEDVKVPWDGWKVKDLLGSGSFGKVYLIERTVLGSVSQAAMKVISVPHEASDYKEMLSAGYDRSSINSRFLDDLKDIAGEYTMMNTLKGNSNIIYCEDIYYEEKTEGIGFDLYIRMELLKPMMEAVPNPAPERSVIRLGIDICNALESCRKHKIIHRDIKPSNILMSPEGHFKLGDFGVSKTSERTTGGTRTGTYSFMAPEVYNNLPYNASVDIYSLGMVLYWMLNRRCGPFLPYPPEVPRASQIDEAKQRRFRGEKLPVPMDGNPALQQVVLRTCAFDPKDRFATPTEMAAALMDATKREAAPVPVMETPKQTKQKKAANSQQNIAAEATIGNNWNDAPQQSTAAEATIGNNWNDVPQQSTAAEENISNDSGNLKSTQDHMTVNLSESQAKEGCVRAFVPERTFHIPPNVKDGQTLIFKEKGRYDSKTERLRDLAVTVNIIKTLNDAKPKPAPEPSKQSEPQRVTDWFEFVQDKDASDHLTVTLTIKESNDGCMRALLPDRPFQIPPDVNDGDTLVFKEKGYLDAVTGKYRDLIVRVKLYSEYRNFKLQKERPSVTVCPVTGIEDEAAFGDSELKNGYVFSMYGKLIHLMPDMKDSELVEGVRIRWYESKEFKLLLNNINNQVSIHVDKKYLESLPASLLVWLVSLYQPVKPSLKLLKLPFPSIIVLILAVLIFACIPAAGLAAVIVGGFLVLGAMLRYIWLGLIVKNQKRIATEATRILRQRGLQVLKNNRSSRS